MNSILTFAFFISMALLSCHASLFDTAIQGPNVEKSTLLIKLLGTQDNADYVARHLFEQLDSDQDGLVKVSDVMQELSKTFDSEPDATSELDDSFLAALKEQDPNNDNLLSKKEFTAAFSKGLSIPVTINYDICNGVRDILLPCSRRKYLPFARNLTTTFDRSAARQILAMCETGFSNLDGFETEKCVLSVADAPTFVKKSELSCLNVKKCVNEHFGLTSAESQQKDIDYARSGLQGSARFAVIAGFLFLVLAMASGVGIIAVGALSLVAALFTWIVAIVDTSLWRQREKSLGISYKNLLDHFLWESPKTDDATSDNQEA